MPARRRIRSESPTAPPNIRRRLELARAPHPDLLHPEAEQELFGVWVEPTHGQRYMNHADELTRFKQLHYCIHRLRNMEDTPRSRFERAKWIARYESIRRNLIEANFGLVFSLMQRSRRWMSDRDEVQSEAALALLRAVESFDPWRGFRFSTYASNAILRAISRVTAQEARRRGRLPVTFSSDFERTRAAHVWDESARDQSLEELTRIMHENQAELTELETLVLRKRFPRDSTSPLTLRHIGEHFRLSKERVRQIQQIALGKLRRALDASELDYPGAWRSDRNWADADRRMNRCS